MKYLLTLIILMICIPAWGEELIITAKDINGVEYVCLPKIVVEKGGGWIMLDDEKYYLPDEETITLEWECQREEAQ